MFMICMYTCIFIAGHLDTKGNYFQILQILAFILILSKSQLQTLIFF